MYRTYVDFVVECLYLHSIVVTHLHTLLTPVSISTCPGTKCRLAKVVPFVLNFSSPTIASAYLAALMSSPHRRCGLGEKSGVAHLLIFEI